MAHPRNEAPDFGPICDLKIKAHEGACPVHKEIAEVRGAISLTKWLTVILLPVIGLALGAFIDHKVDAAFARWTKQAPPESSVLMGTAHAARVSPVDAGAR